MNKLCYWFLFLMIALSGCDKNLDVTLNYNPFDPEYIGPNVIFIDSLVPKYFSLVNLYGDTIYYNRTVHFFIHKNYYCKNGCMCSFFQNGDFAGISYPFNSDYIDKTIFISGAGNYSFDVALGAGGNYSKHSEALTVNFK
jgi:hypothetical protein